MSTASTDVSSRTSVHALVDQAAALGDVTGVIHAAGLSPSQASPATILAVDLFGTALVLEDFGNVIARGGAGVVIASMSGHRLGALTPEQNTALATTPADQLLSSPMLQPDQVKDSLHAYQLSKRGNGLRVCRLLMELRASIAKGQNGEVDPSQIWFATRPRQHRRLAET